MRIWVFAAVAIAALGWAYWPHPISATMVLYPGSMSETQVLVLKTEAELPPIGHEARRALLVDFPKNRHFSAFAVGPDQRFGWVGNRHDIHTARRGALSRCGTGCEVIVELYPPGYAKPKAGMQSVSAKVSDQLARRAFPGPEQSVFYSLAANGSWAVQHADETGPLAGFQVHRRCRAFLRETQPDADCVLFYGPVQSSGLDGGLQTPQP